MNKTWRVTKVTAVEGKTTAELVAVEWFKKHPAWEQREAEYERIALAEGTAAADAASLVWEAEGDLPEWLDDVQPGDEGSEFLEADGSMSIDVTDGPALAPGDDVLVTVEVVERVEA